MDPATRISGMRTAAIGLIGLGIGWATEQPGIPVGTLLGCLVYDFVQLCRGV